VEKAGVQKGGPTTLHVFYFVGRQYHYLSISDQGPSHSATESPSFRFNVKVLTGPSLIGEEEPENMFSLGTRTRSRRLSVLSHGTHLP